MARSTINKIILVGNLGSDPELRELKSGAHVLQLSLATTSEWKKDNEKQAETQWHRVVFWNRAAEIIAKYTKKGDKLFVEGELRYRKHKDKEGVERVQSEILGREFEFLPSGKSGNSTNKSASTQGQAAPSNQQSDNAKGDDDLVPFQEPQDFGDNGFDQEQDIPF